uniref:Premelanosome protein a n=1 Tax=Myripristis murdjan TaxID=586833 RepID=A0A668AF43_9TELE
FLRGATNPPDHVLRIVKLCATLFSGGEVTFDLKNDAPTLTGAKATFTIDLRFPPNQTVLPNGQVIWARNCTVNGKEYQQGQDVYPDQDPDWTGVFPDGTPFIRRQNKKPRYVFVWKTWEGIESVEIVQVTSVVSMATELDLPNEVCTVISDADCITPVETVCNAATPSPDCQMILRQFFNDSGVFCINVSLTNDVSLAVASSGTSPAGATATVLGVLVVACVVGSIYLQQKLHILFPFCFDWIQFTQLICIPRQAVQAVSTTKGRSCYQYWRQLYNNVSAFAVVELAEPTITRREPPAASGQGGLKVMSPPAVSIYKCIGFTHNTLTVIIL